MAVICSKSSHGMQDLSLGSKVMVVREYLQDLLQLW